MKTTGVQFTYKVMVIGSNSGTTARNMVIDFANNNTKQ
jgi:hypothetical protein